jgi:hypothetical protein
MDTVFLNNNSFFDEMQAKNQTFKPVKKILKKKDGFLSTDALSTDAFKAAFWRAFFSSSAASLTSC